MISMNVEMISVILDKIAKPHLVGHFHQHCFSQSRSLHPLVMDISRQFHGKYRRHSDEANLCICLREGQITCICYALIGIPIFLLCLANISSILGDMFRFMYSTFLHFMCCCCRVYMRNRRRKQRRLKGASYNDHFSMGYVGKESIDPNWPEAAQQHNGEQLSDEEYDLDDEDESEMDDVWTRMESRVPILVVILIIIGYVCVGAFVFNRFEGWSMVISVYFCYITLSTIGFGDYVKQKPSTNFIYLSARLFRYQE